MKRKWDFNDAEKQRKCVDEIITKVDEATDFEIGVIAAQDIIDIVTEHLAPEIYNQGLRDAKKVLSDKLSDIEVGIDTLEQRL